MLHLRKNESRCWDVVEPECLRLPLQLPLLLLLQLLRPYYYHYLLLLPSTSSPAETVRGFRIFS